MIELGDKLKHAREKSGVTIEEAAEDIKVTPENLMSIEAGDSEEFKDIYYLKNIIEEYAKYLGIDSTKLIDEFNEFLFDYTSKIPIEAIKEASKEKTISVNKIVSPYTAKEEGNKKIKSIYIYGIIVALVLVAVFLIYKIFI